MNPEQLLDRFSTHLKNAVARAMALATSLEQPEVSPLHLLVALGEEAGSISAEVLKKNQLPTAVLYRLLKAEPQLKKSAGKIILATLPALDMASRQIMEKAMLTAYERGHQHIGTEHLLWSWLNSQHASVKEVAQVCALKLSAINEELESVLQNTSNFPDIEEMNNLLSQLEDSVGANPALSLPMPANSSAKNKKGLNILNVFTTDLTDQQIQKNIDPVIGREKEIERLIHILCRRTKNNPVLIGEPGVGKTAIVEGLAKKIAAGEVPAILRDKKVLALDLTLLVAGTIYRGEFEARLKQVVEEISKSPNTILFIDELHNIIGAGSSQGAMDAANILKPALARGNLRCIGATTFTEYKKHISSDPALERRFQPVIIEEPDSEQTIKILAGVKKYYENFHQVKITDEAIAAAVSLSNRYIHDNFQPDKALDLIDEAGAAVRTGIKPTPLMEEREKLKQELQNLLEKKAAAIHNEKFAEAIAGKKKILKTEKQLAVIENELKNSRQTPGKKVTKKEIIQVLASRLNIAEKILANDEWQELETLPARLAKHILGQETAINQLVKTLKKAELQLNTRRKPLASLLFAGPSGVGKTALAKALAEELFHDEKALVRLDMSEFSESHSTAKLLGSPAGYIGHKDRNRFTDEIRQRPYCVLLLDEIDKAHRDVNELLLQILAEGEITDSAGKKTYFQHAVIILTTNLGAELFKSSGIGFGGSPGSNSELNNQVLAKLKAEFSPALLSRLDATVIFSPLNKETIKKIIVKNIAALSAQLKTKKNFALELEADAAALSAITQTAFSEDEGARQVEKALEDIVQDLLLKIIREEKPKSKYTLTYSNSEYELV